MSDEESTITKEKDAEKNSQKDSASNQASVLSDARATSASKGKLFPLIFVVVFLVAAAYMTSKVYRQHTAPPVEKESILTETSKTAVSSGMTGAEVPITSQKKLGGANDPQVPSLSNTDPQSAKPIGVVADPSHGNQNSGANGGYGNTVNGQPATDPDAWLDAPIMVGESKSTFGGSSGAGVGKLNWQMPQQPQSQASNTKAFEKTILDATQNLTDSLGASSGGFTGLGGSESGGGSLNLRHTATPSMKASLIGPRNWILAKGEMIDCVLDTALDTSVSGMTRCTVSKNVYSDNGKVVLIERGSTATGEYKGSIQNGLSRLAVLWNRIRTPQGVIIDLDSPGTDSLGRSGLDGSIDNHWGQRLGAAFLLSMIDDFVSYKTATNASAGSAAGASAYSNTLSNGQSMADTVLKQTINIAPTLVRPQGTRLSIFVARDLDFSPVYELKLSDKQ